MNQSPPERENGSAFLPVKIPKRVFDSFDPGVQRFIEWRVRLGEAIILEDEAIGRQPG